MPGSVELLKKLINKGARINSDQSGDCKSLIYAAANARTDFISILLGNGAKIDSRDKYGDTALLIASKNKGLLFVNTVKQLLSAGANPDIQNNLGYTALIVAENKEIIDLLLKYRANTELKDNEGKTAKDHHEMKKIRLLT